MTRKELNQIYRQIRNKFQNRNFRKLNELFFELKMANIFLDNIQKEIEDREKRILEIVKQLEDNGIKIT